LSLKLIRKTYDWVLHWAETPYGTWALFVLAFCESSFFPIPPDILLIALAISIPLKSFKYALVCSVGSVLGGAFGYFIGIQLMDTIGKPILEFYGVKGKYEYIGGLYNQYNAWAVGIAGFTPIPYKVFTIAAGAFKIDFLVFILASFISRSARFFIVAGLIYKFGSPIKIFIDKYFNLLTIVFTVLLILGFVLIKYIF
jgi:membrane protein YqaA with SNARE-associated domain|tara:strand:- start:149 stop:742 length:594 start_codon:yes stop_codon:yes gene_type:complete